MKVWTDALRTAGGGWRDQRETLRGSRSDLAAADRGSGALGPRVAPVAATFLNTWIVELGALRDAAERHADALDGAAADYAATDAASADELASLLPWSQRTMRPGP